MWNIWCKDPSIIFIFLRLWEWVSEWDKVQVSTHEQGERQREKEKQTAEQGARLGSVPGPWDHAPSQRQMPNQLSYPAAPIIFNF